MRKAVLALALVLVAASGWGGVQYEFIETSQADGSQLPPTHLTGRVVIDGDKSRVDFVSGNIYAPGAYVISTDGSRTMLFVDPVSRSYSEINALAVAAAYGTANVAVTNLKTNLEKLADQAVIAGVPTSHYHLTITYDLMLRYGALPLKQSVREDIDAWTTTAFGDIAGNFFTHGMIRTGNPELDKILDAETTPIKGFPLRQKTLITTTNPRGSNPSSQLQIAPTRTQQREVQVQSIAKVNADPAMFTVPTTFSKVDPNQQVPLNNKPPVAVLTFDDAKQP